MSALFMLRAATPLTLAMMAATLAAVSLAACVSSNKIDTSTGSGGSSSNGHQGGASSSTPPSGSTSDGSGAGGSSLGDPCAGFADGTHCGGDLGGTAEHASMYTCSGGSTAQAEGCKSGCKDGACTPSPDDPCGSAELGEGPHCGGTLTGGDPKTLYTCKGGVTSSEKICPRGCKVNPQGTPDACNPSSDPCIDANGDGHYCAASLDGGDPNVLYRCENNTTAEETTCPAGCQVKPPGTPDICTPPGSGQCCVKKPAGALIVPYSACKSGGYHYGMDYGAAEGTPIYAGIAGTVTGTATGLPNCYENGCSAACSSAFNYVRIKADCGDPADPLKDLYVYYLHINALGPGIKSGSLVSQGQLLAYSGSSGCSSGPHIHIEIVSTSEGSEASLGTCASVDPTTRYCK
jgi:hypothetical protein